MEEIKNISQGGGFIVNETAANTVFTPEDFSEEQLMMKESVQEFVDRDIVPNRERFEQKDYDLTRDMMAKAGGLGFLGVAVPEAYNGLGMPFTSTMLVCDYISGANGSFSTAFGAHTGIGTMPITLYGNEEQKQKYVSKLATGEWFGAYCLTEPGAGSDANSGKTKAVLSEDGTHYKITGQKMWISNAGFAHIFIVFARIGDDKNITGFIVPKDLENGITLGEEENKLGIKASSTRQVFFNETKVPVEDMLAGRGDGFKIGMNALNVGRIKLAAACLEAQRRVTTLATQYATERVQFKTPIAQFGAIQQKLAVMATNTYVSESASYRAAFDIEEKIAQLLEQGLSHQEAELKGVEEFAIECSILKVSVSEKAQDCTDEGIQIYGGMGFSADAPMEMAWRDARIARIYEGTNEINRMLCVGMLLKKGFKGEIDLMSAATKVGQELMEGIPKTELSNAFFAEEKSLLQNLKKAMLMITGAAVQKFGPKFDKEQQIILALSDILIEIYMIESAILRTEKNCERFGLDSQKNQIDMTQLYLFDAIEKINSKGKEAIVSFADGAQLKGMIAGLRQYTKYQNYPNVVALRRNIAATLIEENKYPF
ncbi:acyl-CoA dehydrogenase family protein [Flavobacteriaceae bacterium]|nr:acyl-CoA dehydrogenase family protein [Flavobacteriaceae bacterium]MDB9899395.1 acyl-CoA dehydrogenase family protein [Flavobacteriaceae bacterium]PTM01843.1 MAG: acyl-CoA dehydrogenase [Candidatus Arcticimaribacter sp.]